MILGRLLISAFQSFKCQFFLNCEDQTPVSSLEHYRAEIDTALGKSKVSKLAFLLKTRGNSKKLENCPSSRVAFAPPQSKS